MRQYTKDELIAALKEIRSRGPISCRRVGNVGGVGNTLEDLLGLTENNLPMPNAAEWELKTQRHKAKSLITLFHAEPSPKGMSLVSKQLLPLYGWSHKKAGQEGYLVDEKSFRQTINTLYRSDRGFKVEVDEVNKKVNISFDANLVAPKHKNWLTSVNERIGLGELEPQPYWGFNDLIHKAGTKLGNCFFIVAVVTKQSGEQFYHYQDILMLQSFNPDKFLDGIRQGLIYVDFDARTGHNHGTKFRIKQNHLQNLYETVTII